MASLDDTINSESSTQEHQKKLPRFKKVIRVGPWRNKAEFTMVYKWLFDEDANEETRKNACNRMLIWKMRRQELTPVAILCTLIMVEMQLKDNNAQLTKNLTNEDLKIMYASTCTRFLNYLSSILQTKALKTMYETANELGLGSFLVDLRHLCAHGHELPDIYLFRQTTKYCINWLKEYYWDHEIKYMEDVNAKDIRRLGRNKFDEEINQLFMIYDAITEGLIKDCKRTQKAKKCLSASTYIVLKRFANIQENHDLKELLKICLKKLSSIVKQEDILRGGRQVYLEALINMNFFFESAAYRTTNSEEIALMIEIHQPLFQAMAIFGFIEKLFHKLIIVAENEYDSIVRRKGASFWAQQIIKGFIAFRKFKFEYKKISTKRPCRKISVGTINTPTISKSILKIYKNLKIDINQTLLFGDSERTPWSLYFTRDYTQARIFKINEFTKDIIKDCLQLIIPSLNSDEEASLIKLIEVYVQSNIDNDSKDNNDDEENENNEEVLEEIPKKKLKRIIDDSKIYTLSDFTGDNNSISKNENIQKDRKRKIWSRTPESQDWSRCPIGRLIWEE